MWDGVVLLKAENGCISWSRERGLSLLLPFYSIQTLNRLDDAQMHWRGQSSLLRPQIQMLISSRDSPTDKPINNILPAIRLSLSPVELTHKINHLGITDNPGSIVTPIVTLFLEMPFWSVTIQSCAWMSIIFIDMTRTRTSYWKDYHLKQGSSSRNVPISRLSWSYSLSLGARLFLV